MQKLFLKIIFFALVFLFSNYSSAGDGSNFVQVHFQSVVSYIKMYTGNEACHFERFRVLHPDLCYYYDDFLGIWITRENYFRHYYNYHPHPDPRHEHHHHHHRHW